MEVVNHKLTATHFNSIDEIVHALDMLSERPGLLDTKAKLEKNAANASQQLASMRLELSEAEHNVEPDLTKADVNQSLKSNREKMLIAQFEAERLERIIREQKLFLEKQATLLNQIESQQQRVLQAKSEFDEISAESGMAFRRRVQIQMVERLLSRANDMLEKISGRYYVRQRPSERGLGLLIEDTYQGNVRRLPKSLSGGESFIVSLALALGLSELATNGRAVDSLFLDEGFGNLDAENLYTVVNTLESLKAHGKTVGVISHVEGGAKTF